MFPANTYVIRTASEADGEALARIAALDSKPALDGPILAGEIGGEIAAAISVNDGRVIADPFARTGPLAIQLGIRAAGLRAYERTPSVAQRIRAALAPSALRGATAA